MKCLKCVFVTSESKVACGRCGASMPVKERGQSGADHRKPQAAPAQPPAASGPGREPGPAWRREVTRKVKEYGEKRKYLTPPPQPLKERNPETDEAPAAAVESEPGPSAPPPAMRPQPVEPPRRQHRPAPP